MASAITTKQRDLRLDVWRGLCLVDMVLVHCIVVVVTWAFAAVTEGLEQSRPRWPIRQLTAPLTVAAALVVLGVRAWL